MSAAPVELPPSLRNTLELFKGRRQLMNYDVAEKLGITEAAARGRLARLVREHNLLEVQHAHGYAFYRRNRGARP